MNTYRYGMQMSLNLLLVVVSFAVFAHKEIMKLCAVNLKKWLLLLGFFKSVGAKNLITIQRFCAHALNSSHRHSVKGKKVTRPHRQMHNLRVLAVNLLQPNAVKFLTSPDQLLLWPSMYSIYHDL